MSFQIPYNIDISNTSTNKSVDHFRRIRKIAKNDYYILTNFYFLNNVLQLRI